MPNCIPDNSSTVSADQNSGFKLGQLVEIEGRGLAELKRYLGAGMWQVEIETESVHKFATIEEKRFSKVEVPQTNLEKAVARAISESLRADVRGCSIYQVDGDRFVIINTIPPQGWVFVAAFEGGLINSENLSDVEKRQSGPWVSRVALAARRAA